MMKVSKLQISPSCGGTGLYEIGENQVESIDINKEMELIEIKYNNGSKWKIS